MNRCIVCNRVLTDKILELPHMPMAAQNMPGAEELEGEHDITLSLYECPGCGLIQFDTLPVPYYRDVIRATGVSEKFRKLREDQYTRFIDAFQLSGKKILEVGCGAGEFLEILSAFPVQPKGIEHNRNLISSARAKNLDVSEGFIESEYDIVEGGPYDAFLSFNFFEHQPNPGGMLRGIYENLTENGAGLITVPSFEYFQEKASYYEFLRDHIAYYTKETMERLLQINGFEIVESRRFNNDTLELFVRKRAKTVLADYTAQREELQKNMNLLLDEIKEIDGDVYVWGASHQAFTLLSTLQIDTPVAGIIDSASFKWNKFSPATHIPIMSPEILSRETPKCIIIMAPGFSDEICRQILALNGKVERVLSVIDGEILKPVWKEGSDT